MSQRIILLALLVCAAVPTAGATTARELLNQAKQLSQTTRKWNDRVERLKLRIIDRRGGERDRELVIKSKKYPEDRSRSIVFFESPPEVKGVGFLQWADPHAKEEQWLYLPELKRPRQISAGGGRESFVGTDFSYEDLAIIGEITDWADAEARTTVLREELLDGRSCHVIELTPTGKELTYGKILTWLTADDLVIVKFEMYDKAGRLDKLLTLGDIRNIGAIPTVFTMEMKNAQSGSHTIVHFEDVRYDTGLPDETFTQRALENGL